MNMPATTGAAPATAIIGLGVSGLSCLRFLYGRSDCGPLVVFDSRVAPPGLAAARAEFGNVDYQLGGCRAPDWSRIKRLIVSPGIAPTDPLLRGSEHLQRLSDIDLFTGAAAAPIVGITGTNGKSTVTALLGHMFKKLGFDVPVGGNLGQPALDLLDPRAQAYVLELSSFQLENSSSLSLAVATVLNLSDDHLDRHGTIAAYGAIKRRIYTDASICVFNLDDPATFPKRPASPPQASVQTQSSFGSQSADWSVQQTNSQVQLIHKGTAFADAAEFGLVGRHNQFNLLAAFALTDALARASVLPQLTNFAANPAAYVRAARGFKGLVHRCELIAEIDGVRYVNDSKATNVGACVAALEGLGSRCAQRQPRIILLAGGQGKGANFSPLVAPIQRHTKLVLLFGEDARLLDAVLPQNVARAHSHDLRAAVVQARAAALPGDLVLLAPACASFDMFDDFGARGDAFRSCVESMR